VFRGQHYTERADCYSYGILLWELFTRKYPFGQLNPRRFVLFVGLYVCMYILFLCVVGVVCGCVDK
jgi:hypothetical protein